MADVAMPAVTNANIKLRKKVLLIGLISSPPSDLGPAFQNMCQFNDLAAWRGLVRERPVAGKG
jgi:hypothetical protein